jgi:hypothetical protein
MNILGQPFAPWVTNQIKVRQKSLGDSTNLSTTNLLYQNSKTPWIRMASSVNVRKTKNENGNYQKLLSAGFTESEISGDNIARNFILQGGVTKLIGKDLAPTVAYEEGTRGQNVGLNTSNKQFSGAYGWGGLDGRGYVPMPGIIDAKVQYYNNGALSKATIKMRCFSRKQLTLMDILYMRPGYNLLLEFGWSAYLNNSGEIQNYDNFFSPALSFMFNPTSQSGESATHFDVLDLIQSERKTRYGNYEGVFGKVTNFDWSFNPDGSYDCSVNLIGMGDMMESLKVNIKLPSKSDNDQEPSPANTPGEEEQIPLIANKDKTTLNKLLFGLYEQVNKSTDNDAFWTLKLPNMPLAQVSIDKITKDQTTKFEKEKLIIPKGMLSVTGVTTDGETNQSPQVYITFGGLLALVQKYLLLYNENGCPLVDFDVDFKNISNDENYIVKVPGQFSSNPLKCLIPYSGANIPSGVFSPATGTEFVNLGEKDIVYPETALNDIMKKSLNNWNYQQYLGRLMHVYLNMNNVAKILNDAPREDDGSLSLLSFLDNIITDFTQALGGINMISIKYDTDIGKIKFIENAPQRFDEEISESEYAMFNTYGVKPGIEGSFVRNIVMGGSLGPEYASMIVIGAQYAGNKLTANSTGFSKYNEGLVDRVIKVKANADKYDHGSEEEEDTNEIKTISDAWNKQINFSSEDSPSLFHSIYQDKNFIQEDVAALTELNFNYLNMIVGWLVNNKQLQSPSFLPMNLSIDIDGLSGIKLFERFSMDDRILPPSYGKNNVDLLAKSINHIITTDSWITSIDTQMVPRSKMNPIKSPSPLNSDMTSQNSTTNPIQGGGSTDLQTLTSSFPLAKIFYDGPTSKKQIFIHHTAGATKSPERTVAGWNTRTDHVATHYITNNIGDVEQVFSDEAWANHLGIKASTFDKLGIKRQNLNKTSLSIEMQSYGWCNLVEGKYITAYKNELPASKIGRPVDKNGNFISYKGHIYYEKYNSQSINNVKNILQGWMSKYNIPFVYDYDLLFPNLNDTISVEALKGTPGIYTHNSIRRDKSDVWPQQELIDMLKSL